MTCPQCKHVYCWICKKDLTHDHYKHFKVGERPFGCGLVLYGENFFLVLLSLGIRHYTVPAIWWYKYIRKKMLLPMSDFIMVDADRDNFFTMLAIVFFFGIINLTITLLFLSIVMPFVEVYILYNNVFILMRKYVCCCV